MIGGLASAQTGGAFDLEDATVDAGGATFSTGGVYRLGGTIGQPDAGALSGGAYALAGGFWSALPAALTPTPTKTGTVEPTRTATVTATRTATKTGTGPPAATSTPTATAATPTRTRTATPSGTPVLTPLVVNVTDDTDDGSCNAIHCSLREAINAANAHPGPDAIHFDIPNAAPGCERTGVCTIQPASLLPFLTDDDTTIDGYTQPGAQSGDEPSLKIVLDGHDNGNFSGLTIRSADNLIRGLVIQRFTPFTGIDIGGTAATGNRIEANFIGTDATGTQPRGNCSPPVSCAGIWLKDGAHDNTIGPDNLIAFNGQGVWVTEAGTRGNTITRNRIHSNPAAAILLQYGGNDELPAPLIVSANATEVSGTACGGCVVEVFSDAEDEGALYEGSVTASGTGGWTFVKSSGLSGPHVTATATDADGNTSEFSIPAKISCVGDCDGEDGVTVDELITMANIALGTFPASRCDAGDVNGDRRITISEILTAVNNVLSNCRGSLQPSALSAQPDIEPGAAR